MKKFKIIITTKTNPDKILYQTGVKYRDFQQAHKHTQGACREFRKRGEEPVIKSIKEI